MTIPGRPVKLYTVGYQRKAPEELLRLLLREKVRLVADVRKRASSRRPAFSKKALGSMLGQEGIAYRHFPELGSGPEMRRALLSGGDFECFAGDYLAMLANLEGSLSELLSLAAAASTCLLCYEADPSQCHRSLVAIELARLSPGLSVVHL